MSSARRRGQHRRDDTLHVAVAPVELGAGSRLWNSPEELLYRYHRDVVPSPGGVVHHLFWRR
ncbi:MAG TPA: hypothetical protein VFJ12_00645 [Segeticoccus sp.]|nr:hypothetical protein [Segeticoccus sp.]